MKYLSRAFQLLALFFVFACASKENAEATMDFANSEEMESLIPATEQAPPPEPSDQSVSVNQKLIKEGRLSFETTDLSKTRAQVLTAVQNSSGYISSDRESKEWDRNVQEITIRVPSKNFDRLVEAVGQGVKSFEVKDLSVRDVTEEYLDVEARVKTKKELEARYLQLLQKAKTIKEIMEVEQEIGKLRSDIEAAEGRLKYLGNRVALSTLHITFYQKIEFPEAEKQGPRFGKEFAEAFVSGWNGLIWFLVGLVNLWPFLLIIAGVVVLWRKVKKAKKD